MIKSLIEEIEQLERLIASAEHGSTQFKEVVGAEPLEDITPRRIDEMRARLAYLKSEDKKISFARRLTGANDAAHVRGGRRFNGGQFEHRNGRA